MLYRRTPSCVLQNAPSSAVKAFKNLALVEISNNFPGSFETQPGNLMGFRSWITGARQPPGMIGTIQLATALALHQRNRVLLISIVHRQLSLEVVLLLLSIERITRAVETTLYTFR